MIMNDCQEKQDDKNMISNLRGTRITRETYLLLTFMGDDSKIELLQVNQDNNVRWHFD